MNLRTRLDTLDVTVRLANLLHNAGIQTVRALLRYSVRDMLILRGSNRRVILELRTLLAESNYTLDGDSLDAVREEAEANERAITHKLTHCPSCGRAYR